MKQNKIDRRAAIGLLGCAAGIIPIETAIVDAEQNRPKIQVVLEMDRFVGFTVKYKNKTMEFTTEEVMDALFGSGTFGN